MEESEWGKRTMNESRGGVEALGELSRISFSVEETEETLSAEGPD
jgi:hypothetical protein